MEESTRGCGVVFIEWLRHRAWKRKRELARLNRRIMPSSLKNLLSSTFHRANSEVHEQLGSSAVEADGGRLAQIERSRVPKQKVPMGPRWKQD